MGKENREQFLLYAQNICKAFPGVQALQGVQLGVRPGEIHALIGENGAGKSTLMKIILGIYSADSGEILFDGKPLNNSSPAEVLKRGISMIHQELSLAQNMTVAENIWVGRFPKTRLGTLDYPALFQKTSKLFEELKITLDPRTPTAELSVAQMQMVEIARAASYDAKLIIMDEPTSALSEQEVQTLFNIIRAFKAKGVSVILITHKLDEIFVISDCVTVLRDGQFVCEHAIGNITKDQLIAHMVGRELTVLFPKEDIPIGEPALEVRNLSRKGVFQKISFRVHKGEILGIAGLMGAGRTEIVRAIFGIDKLSGGEILLDGKPVSIASSRDAIRNGLAMVTEDRRRYGLSLNRSVQENILISHLRALSKYAVALPRKQRTAVADMQKLLSIKVPGMEQPVRLLSGGNQQKVILSRWLLTEPKVLILDEPTRGIDVGAKAEVYRLISSFAAKGMAIIMISSELQEILGMSDRVLVVGEGEIKSEFAAAEATQENIMAHAIRQ